MKPERWKQIERLYHAALEREAERAAFLDEACAATRNCGGSQSLLASDAEAGSFLATPAAGDVAQGDRRGTDPSRIGRRSGTTRFCRCWAQAAWAKSIWPRTRGWSARWRSSCCPPSSPPTPGECAASRRRRAPPRRSIIRTSSRFTRSAKSRNTALHRHRVRRGRDAAPANVRARRNNG